MKKLWFFEKKNIIWFLKTIIITVFLQLPECDFLISQKTIIIVFFCKKTESGFFNVEKNHSNDVFLFDPETGSCFFLSTDV